MKLDTEKLFVKFKTELVNDMDQVITCEIQKLADGTLEETFKIDKGQIIDMLKRNRPAKVENTDPPNNGYYRCPNCRHVVDHLNNYCNHCGQALDFTEDE